MTRREVLLLLVVVACAFAAAVPFRVAAHPGDLHDPAYAASFDAAVDNFPVLGAVRVRANEPDAAHRIRSATGAVVVDPLRAERAFRFGRLLYATADEVRAVRDALRRGERPGTLPDIPDIAKYFFDARGPYSCDVILETPRDLDRIRTLLPGAELGGEPVLRERERSDARETPRILLVVLVLGYAWCRFRGRHAERRLLAAVAPLALLGVLGWGIDFWTVPALAVAVVAPDGPLLLCGALCLFSPAMMLKRMGLVFLVGAVVRWRGLLARVPGDRRPPALLLVVLGGLGAVALFVSAPALPQPEASAVRFVDRSALDDPVPPDADRPTRVMLAEIFDRASRLGFDDVRDAAAVTSLYWPLDLKRRLRTRDGRAALLVVRPELDGETVHSPELYRVRGARDLAHDARVFAWLLYVVGGAVLVARRRAFRSLLLGFVPLVAAAAFLPAVALPAAVVLVQSSSSPTRSPFSNRSGPPSSSSRLLAS